MPEVNPITGQPAARDREEKRKEQEILKQRTSQEKLLDAFSIKSELKSAEGMRLVQIMEDTLKRRIEKLIHEDIECKAILSILEQIGVKINWSDETSKRIIERTLNILSPA